MCVTFSFSLETETFTCNALSFQLTNTPKWFHTVWDVCFTRLFLYRNYEKLKSTKPSMTLSKVWTWFLGRWMSLVLVLLDLAVRGLGLIRFASVCGKLWLLITTIITFLLSRRNREVDCCGSLVPWLRYKLVNLFWGLSCCSHTTNLMRKSFRAAGKCIQTGQHTSWNMSQTTCKCSLTSLIPVCSQYSRTCDSNF